MRVDTRKIFTIGETVLDILFKKEQPIASRAGGSMLNTSVSLGRLGLPVRLITEIAKDEVGDQIVRFLTSNHVDTGSIDRFGQGNTALALAFLDENENASYTFYKNYPPKRMQIKFPRVSSDDILLFGSSFAVAPEVRAPLRSFLIRAKKVGAIIIYDPNFRPVHPPIWPEIKANIIENLEFSDIIRGSNEDFKSIFGVNSADDAYQALPYPKHQFLVYTSGARPVTFRSSFHSFSLKVPLIKPVSTVGAGDNFNAGIIYSLSKLNIMRQDLLSLKTGEWQAILDSGITFGTLVCKSFDNYIPEAFGLKFRGRK